MAEGVEDATTWARLTELGCDSAQGYYLARPMPADLFWGWLKDHGGIVELPDEGEFRGSGRRHRAD